MPGDRLADYWVAEYRRRWRFAPMFDRKDGVLLHRLKKHYGRHSLAWCIRAYLDDEHARFVAREDAGYGANVGGLYKRYTRFHGRWVERQEGLDRVREMGRKAALADMMERPEIAEPVLRLVKGM